MGGYGVCDIIVVYHANMEGYMELEYSLSHYGWLYWRLGESRHRDSCITGESGKTFQCSKHIMKYKYDHYVATSFLRNNDVLIHQKPRLIRSFNFIPAMDK